MPLLVGRKALHQLADLGGEVGFELSVADLKIVQQLFGKLANVALIHQRINQIQRAPVWR